MRPQTRYCPSVVGTWKPENGVLIRIDPGADGELLRESLCRSYGIPTITIYDDPADGITVPRAVFDLVDGAVMFAADRPRAAALMAQARRLLDEAAGRFMPVLAAAE